jgi:diguanylate cyclase (GGDEF)-like protein
MAIETGSKSRLNEYAARLPSLPAVALEVVRLSKQEWVALDDIAKVISRDPALSARLLKLANSPLYLRRRPSATLQDAFRTLGLKAVRMAALSFSVVDLAASKEGFRGFDLRQFWRRAVVQSVVGRALSRAAQRPFDDEAFTLGLLMDVAIPILCRVGGAEYAPVVAEMDAGHPDPASERDAIGTSHDEIAGKLLRDWGLSEEMALAARHHHAPDETLADAAHGKAALDLARIVNLAHHAAGVFVSPRKGDSLRRLLTSAQEWFGLDEARVQALLAEAAPNVESLAIVVAVDIGGSLEVEELLGEARAQLVNLSLGAHHEAEEARARAVDAERRAGCDALTGLKNRGSFDAAFAREWELRRTETDAGPLGLVLVDVDRFKKFNDEAGHQAGDEVLRVVAATLRAAARSDDVVCRYGGEEFVVVAPGADASAVRALSERMRRAVERAAVTVGDATYKVTASFGCVALRGAPGDRTAAEFVKAADEALYAAKNAGRNRVEAAPDF